MEGNWRSRGALAISWNDSKKEKKGKILALALASLVTLAVASPPMRAQMADSMQQMVSVIVRALPGSETAAAETVEQAGGEVGMGIGIINGFTAEVPKGTIGSLEATREIFTVTSDSTLHPQDHDGYDAASDVSSMYNTAQVVQANKVWSRGITGDGVDVALIDTGVSPVAGMDDPGKVINGPDLSFDSQYDEAQYLDGYGHGTHMAGIIAGRDAGFDPASPDPHAFSGIAPDAGILNVKVGDYTGAADVSQVLAAIDWVVQHRNDNGMNIRVLNLSYGTDGTQSYLLDPLTFAVEVAWRHGIVVVVAGGNGGFGSPQLNNPAYDPFVIAVGGNDPSGTIGVGDDTVPDWSSTGDGTRNPDLVAPGKSIAGLRVPGSLIDEEYPTARVGDRYFRGTGTSQSAAVVSGAAALLLDQRPGLTPDQVKALLMGAANRLPQADPIAQGDGELNVHLASQRPTPISVQTFPPATGAGSLELARGTLHLEDGKKQLVGEYDIFGEAFDGRSWSLLSATGRSWSGGDWNGRSWSGSDWSGRSWSGRSWSNEAWSGRSWS